MTRGKKIFGLCLCLIMFGIAFFLGSRLPVSVPIWRIKVKPVVNPIEFLIDRADRPVAGVVITPKTTAELAQWFQGADKNHVPRVFVDKMPKDFKTQGTPQLFAAVISALILRENEKIIKDRAILTLLGTKSPDGTKWTKKEMAYFTHLVKKYNSISKKTIPSQLADLRVKILQIPPLVGILQAAEATDWGKTHWESPFEQTGWLDHRTYARVPFRSLIRATESYVTEMNGMPPLMDWRLARFQGLSDHSDAIGHLAIDRLSEYKLNDPSYAEKLMDRMAEMNFDVPDNLSFIKPQRLSKGKIKIAGHVFEAEFARTPAEKRVGLMFRPQIKPDTGMIFINETPILMGVWMKNTFVSLDVLFFDKNKKVTDIFEQLNPLDETSHRPARPTLGMVELPAGTVQKYKIKVGDKLSF